MSPVTHRMNALNTDVKFGTKFLGKNGENHYFIGSKQGGINSGSA